MKFPLVGDIASTNVISIDIDSSIADAIEHMITYEHRNVLVKDRDNYYIFTVLDVLNIQSEKISLNTKLKSIQLTKIATIDRDQNILETLEYLNDSVEYICVINRDKSLYGLLTHTDITSNIDPDTLMDNFRLDDFLKLGRRVKWVSKEDQTLELLDNMVSGSFDNVIVVEDKKPIGILTTKDVMELIKNRSDLSLCVSNYMSEPVDCISKTATIKEALNFIKKKNYKRVVVVNAEGELAGIIAQKELISLTYSRWAILMKEYQSELSEINHMLENKNKEYEVMASTDSLTGLYNRHKFSELYLSSYTTMIQRDARMSLIIVDIDFFKKVNDTYGHDVGDDVLIELSALVKRNLRDFDILGRYGGEEFLILSPNTTLDDSKHFANRIREEVQNHKFKIVGHITISLGVVELKADENIENVFRRVDSLLYQSKNNGRNTVSF